MCACVQAVDHKNIRRRVYDALNVLMAMNIISKEKKEIRWIGLPTNSLQECQHLEVNALFVFYVPVFVCNSVLACDGATVLSCSGELGGGGGGVTACSLLSQDQLAQCETRVKEKTTQLNELILQVQWIAVYSAQLMVFI